MSIDPLRDLVPVIQLTRQPIVLAVHPLLGVSKLGELTALVRQQPGQRYATGSGVGRPQHMIVAWWARLSDLKVAQVPDRGGGQAINDLLAGHGKIGELGSTPLIPHDNSGALRLLAQSMDVRAASLPDVPTFRAFGPAELVVTRWAFAPVGIPQAQAIVTRRGPGAVWRHRGCFRRVLAQANTRNVAGCYRARDRGLSPCMAADQLPSLDGPCRTLE